MHESLRLVRIFAEWITGPFDDVANLSNSLYDENDDANDNDGSNDPISKHFDSAYVLYLRGEVSLSKALAGHPPSAFDFARAWPLNAVAPQL